MATYTFTGWRQVVIEQSFDIEAGSHEEAKQLLLEMQQNYQLEERWFDYTTNTIKGEMDIDFYDADNNPVDEPMPEAEWF